MLKLNLITALSVLAFWGSLSSCDIHTHAHPQDSVYIKFLCSDEHMDYAVCILFFRHGHRYENHSALISGIRPGGFRFLLGHVEQGLGQNG